MIGLSHRTAPLEIRERFVIEGDAARDALRQLAAGGCDEAVLLSTCNRTELYLRAGSHTDARALAVRFLSGYAGINETDTESYIYQLFDSHAIAHLFRVVGSLDSMVLGEAQIQGQVRTAYELAQGVGVLSGPVLPRLFESALRVGGRIRSETRLGTGAASIPSAALDLARKIFGSLRGRSALVIGAGEMSELTVRCLRDEGVDDVTVVNRTQARAQELAAALNARAIAFTEIPAALATADIVVTATAAPHILLTRELVHAATDHKRERPLLILDIALPRDVEPAVAELDNVFLYDIDDLSQVIEGNIERRHSEIAAAQAIVEAEVDRFEEWYRSRDVAPLIRNLRGWAESVREAETARALRGLKHLSDADRAAVDALTRQLVAKLLHMPSTRLRQAAAGQQDAATAEVAQFLFGLEDEGLLAPDAPLTDVQDSATGTSTTESDVNEG